MLPASFSGNYLAASDGQMFHDLGQHFAALRADAESGRAAALGLGRPAHDPATTPTQNLTA